MERSPRPMKACRAQRPILAAANGEQRILGSRHAVWFYAGWVSSPTLRSVLGNCVWEALKKVEGF